MAEKKPILAGGNGGKIGSIVPDKPITDADRAQDIARRYRCEFVDLNDFQLQHELFKKVPVDLMFRYNFIPLEETRDGKLAIAIADPSQLMMIDEISQDEQTGEETISIDKLTQAGDASPIIRLVDTTIFTALQRRASDIHIETRDDSVAIKFRIDGVLSQAMPPIGKEHHSTIISRIKVMSELDI